ncbi:hypothetical protein M501DRAFT_1021026 [Patellaria atrata CBS 101060]|uniref:Uncharacterized protein n=1 Tax=Patellaria atrata CBS 101060 TaxID=1346257 RepID=A0A9P4S0Q7_9PEZI|nr:hypothetical protein M501DRAFT_1021026 [Patellaria atrata CBS 101060]
MSTSTNPSSQVATVTLKDVSDWHNWYYLIKNQAEMEDIWEYYDPDLQEKPELLSSPPQPANVKEWLRTDTPPTGETQASMTGFKYKKK